MQTDFDIIIIGGGLAGLASAIEHRKQNRSVLLLEKKSYPFHKVCGEYISNESWNYLKYLGVPLDKMDLPQINQLKVSTAEGTELNHVLKAGGFGISRYQLDETLFAIAKQLGAVIKEQSTVQSVEQSDNILKVHYEDSFATAKIVIGAYGKRSNLDKSLKRKFIEKPLSPNKNYVGIKYHIKADLPKNEIGLHIFKDGYCGISKVEGTNRYCLCYLTLASNLQQSGSIEKMEQEILSKNKYLKKYLSFERHYDTPQVISQVNFSSKNAVENEVFMLGDSAGLIVPLCGNGMSMALHSAHQFSVLCESYFKGEINSATLKKQYRKWWNKQFNLRLTSGRLLQKLFYSPLTVNPTLKILARLPGFTDFIVSLTHGKNIK